MTCRLYVENIYLKHLQIKTLLILCWKCKYFFKTQENQGLLPGKIAATVFSSKFEFKEKTQVFSCAKGPEIQLEVLILEFRIRRNL